MNHTKTQSRYRVVDHWQVGIQAGARLRPEGWDGPDLVLCAIDQCETAFPLGSIQVYTPEQRQRWRDKGLLLGPLD